MTPKDGISSSWQADERAACIAVDCGKAIKSPLLMCRRHWGMASVSLRARLSALFNSRDFGPAWDQARQDIIRAVNAFENNLSRR